MTLRRNHVPADESVRGPCQIWPVLTSRGAHEQGLADSLKRQPGSPSSCRVTRRSRSSKVPPAEPLKAAVLAAGVEEQGTAIQEIARNVGASARGSAEVATNITEVDRRAGDTGSASARVLSAAQSLSKESGLLKIEVEKFLDTVRAA
jgi:hypothetical protein